MDSSEMKWVESHKGRTLISSMHTPGWYRAVTVVHGKVKLRSRCRGYWPSHKPELYHAIYGGKSRSYKTLEEAMAVIAVQAKLGVVI